MMDMAGRCRVFFLLCRTSRPRATLHRRVFFCTVTTTGPSEWGGLQAWRASPLDERREWGPKNKSQEPSFAAFDDPIFKLKGNPPSSLAEWGALVLNTPDPLVKAAITHHAFRLWSNHKLPLGSASAPNCPARPDKPLLVPLRQVPDVKNSPLPRNAHALHMLAHIELNAVDLAWDTVVRFSGASNVLGQQFFADFAHVADDESRHFGWCSQRLLELGFCYGDMPAHNMLVDEGQKSAANVMARLAIVPMVQEARGLDSGPRVAARLVGWGDARSASIVNQIAEEELAHVAVGVSWFLAVCKMMNRVPDTSFKEVLREFDVELKGPFNHLARAKAGLPRSWYDSHPDCLVKVEETAICTSMDSKHIQVAQVQEKEANHSGTNEKGSPIKSGSACLSEVYERLELLVAMEKENAA